VRQGYTASAEETATKLSYDLWYLRHRSLTVDLAVLLRTVAVVLRGGVSAGRGSEPAPATGLDPYTELHDRALTTLGSGRAHVSPMSVTVLENEAPRPGELGTTHGLGGGH